jgi:hypothetical protein
MRLLPAALLALLLASCQHRGRYQSSPPADPAPPPFESPRTPEKPIPGPEPAAQSNEPDAKARRSRWAQDEAARLIRESVPLAGEVADAVERPLPADRRELENLRAKARTAHDNLSAARELYIRIEADVENQSQVSDRVRRLNDLMGAMKGALKRIEKAL